MLKLREWIGEGHERVVYRHPHHPDRVVKVPKSDAVTARNEVELVFFRDAPARITARLPRFYGSVETEAGRALCYELICDDDGRPSRPLLKHVLDGSLDIVQATILLNEYFRESQTIGLLTYDQNPRNLLFRRTGDGQGHLIMVDGFGPRRLTMRGRLRSRFPVLARRKIQQSIREGLAMWNEQLSKFPASLRPAE